MCKVNKFILLLFSGLLIVCASLYGQPGSAENLSEWALITVGCAHLRAAPSHASEMVTEAILGTPVQIIDEKEQWYHIRTPEGYVCWVHPASLALKSIAEMEQWKQSTRYIYTGFQGFIYEKPDKESLPVSDITSGCIVTSHGKEKGKYISVALPDGRIGFVHKKEVMEFRHWAGLSPSADRLFSLALQMIGTTYLWGGTSVKGVDCSGFTKIAYYASGLILLRDASQQALTGEQIDKQVWRSCRSGDLIFFGNTTGRINHVGIYMKDGNYIHSSGRVKINSLDPASPLFIPQNFVSVSRVLSAMGTEGIILVKEHPWYFTK